MTCLLVLLISDIFKLDLKQTETVIGQKAAGLQGTSAKLQYGDTIKLIDLLHGLMLPSGNDAALALAEWGGKVIRMSCTRRHDTSSPRMRKPSKI
jgi:D-alanyl-D-alanine carboxypeptidase